METDQGHAVGTVVDQLDLVVPSPNGFQRLQQRMTATRPVAWVFAHTLDPIDSALNAMTRGKLTVPRLMAGLPIVFLTTTGARSGEERTVPLVGVPLDGKVAILGSNYGRRFTPGWVHNLEADPMAKLSHEGRAVAVRALPMAPDMLEQAFEVAIDVYPGYAAYRRRAGARRIRGFLLESA